MGHYITKRLGISQLRPYKTQFNRKGVEFPVSIKKINKFEKDNLGMAVNVVFSNKKSQKKNIYTVHMSERNVNWKKQVNLLMV